MLTLNQRMFKSLFAKEHKHFYYAKKWNEMNEVLGHLCAHSRLNWARRTSGGWWDEWDGTALQTQDSKYEPWRSDAEHATSRSRRFPTILNLYEWVGKKHFVSLKLEDKSGFRTRDLRLYKQAALTTAPRPPRPLNTRWPNVVLMLWFIIRWTFFQPLTWKKAK